MDLSEKDRHGRFAERLAEVDANIATGETPERIADDTEMDGDPDFMRALRCVQLLDEARRELLASWTPKSEPLSELLESVASGNGASGFAVAGDDASIGASIRSDASGQNRVDRYVLERELGSGGFGVVYLAYDPELNRRVALKIPRLETLLSREARERFAVEVRAVATLNHAGIVPLFEARSDGPVLYMASAYIAGESLSEHLRQRPKSMTAMESARLLESLADAVQHAHSRDILHRDLKPSNVILDENGRPHVTDFGLARIVGEAAPSMTRTGAVVGTPAYMSPEQAAGAEIGPATDIYALGAILYELLTGQPPFIGSTALEILRKVESDAPAPPRRLKTSTPADIQAVCLKCLEKRPADRYSSATELSADLGRFLNGQPVRARVIGSVEKSWRWCRRNPVIASLMALTVVFAVAAGAAAYVATSALHRALQAEDSLLDEKTLAEKRLGESLIVRAKLGRNGEPGQSVEGLKLLEEAAGLLPIAELSKEKQLEFRSEVAACLTSPDLVASDHADLRETNGRFHCIDPEHRWFAVLEDDGVSIQYSENRSAGTAARVVEIPLHAQQEPSSRIYSLLPSRHGKYLVGYSRELIRIFRAATGKEVLTVRRQVSTLLPAAFNADESLVSICTPDSVRIFNLAAGEVVTKVPGTATATAFSIDGKRLAIALRDRRGFALMSHSLTDLSDQSRVLVSHAVRALAWNAAGDVIIAGSNRGAFRWKTASDRPELIALGDVTGVEFASDDSSVVLLLDNAELQVRDKSLEHLLVRTPIHVKGGLTVTDDDRIMVHSTTRDSTQEWQLLRPPAFITSSARPDVPVQTLISGPLPGQVTIGDESVRIIDASDGSVAGTWPPRRGYNLADGDTPEHYSTVHQAAHAKSENSLRVVSRVQEAFRRGEKRPDYRDTIYRMLTIDVMPDSGGQPRFEPRDSIPVRYPVFFSDNGRFAVFRPRDSETRNIFDCESKAEWAQTNRAVYAVANDGQWAVMSIKEGPPFFAREAVGVFALPSGRLIHRLGTDTGSNRLPLSSDGRWLVAANSDEYVVFSTDTWKPHFRIPVTESSPKIFPMAISPDSQLLALATRRSEITIWDIETAAPILELASPAPVTAIVFLPNNEKLCVGTEDAKVHLWNLDNIIQVLSELNPRTRDLLLPNRIQQ